MKNKSLKKLFKRIGSNVHPLITQKNMSSLWKCYIIRTNFSYWQDYKYLKYSKCSSISVLPFNCLSSPEMKEVVSNILKNCFDSFVSEWLYYLQINCKYFKTILTPRDLHQIIIIRISRISKRTLVLRKKIVLQNLKTIEN